MHIRINRASGYRGKEIIMNTQAFAGARPHNPLEGLSLDLNPPKEFSINDGVDGIWSLQDMVETNYDDVEFCAWAREAKVGDIYVGLGEKCQCVAAS